MGRHINKTLHFLGFLLGTLLIVVERLGNVDGENVTVPKGEDVVLPCVVDLDDFFRRYECRLHFIDVRWSESSGRRVCSCHGILELYGGYYDHIDCSCPASLYLSRNSIITKAGNISDLLDFSLKISNTTLADAGQYTCYVDMHRYEFTRYVTLSVVIPPDAGYPVCSVDSIGQSIDMTKSTMKILVRCESKGGNPFVTVKLVSETGSVVGMESGFGNETTVVMYEFISSKEDAGKTFTCHVIQGDIVTASCSTLPTTILEVYAFEEPKLSDALLFTCAGHNKASMTLFTWYINDVRIINRPGLFEIPTNGYILIVHTVYAVINNNHLIVVCEATDENGTASAQLTLNRTDEIVTTLSRETTKSQFPMDVTSPSFLKHQQSQSIRNQSNGVSIAGAFIGGVLSAVLCLTVIVIVYHWRTGKLRKIFRLVWCRNAENNNENVDEITKRQRRENDYFEKGKTLPQVDTDAEAYENVAMDAIVQKTDTCEHYTDLTQQAPVSVYQKLHHGIADSSKNSEDVYETV